MVILKWCHHQPRFYKFIKEFKKSSYIRDLAAQAEQQPRRDFSKTDSRLRTLLDDILIFNPLNRPSTDKLLDLWKTFNYNDNQ